MNQVNAIIVLTVLLATGCTVTNYTNARTLGKGNFEVVAEPSGVISTGDPNGFASFAVSGRLGVTDRFDLGLRLNPLGAGILSKVALTDPDQGKVDVALAPSVNAFFVLDSTDGGLVQLTAPLLVGVDVREQDQLVLGVGSSILLSQGETSVTVLTSVGYQLRLSPLLALHPEVGALIPISGMDGSNAPLIQAGVGVVVGSRDRR
ncbi:MAG: hypothetical protein AAFV53_08340 [Myxococcota bacterium]